MGSNPFGILMFIGFIILVFFINMFIMLWMIKLSMNFSICRRLMRDIMDRADRDG